MIFNLPISLIGAIAILFSVSAFATGLVPETAHVQTVVMGSGDGHEAGLGLHYQILKGLPKDVRAILLYKDGVDWTDQKDLKRDFASGRFKVFQVPNMTSNWVRDYLPDVVSYGQDKPVALVSFEYRKPCNDPKAAMRFPQICVPAKAARVARMNLASTSGLNFQLSKIDLEGGNLMVDDNENLFVTTKIEEANPKVTRKEIESELRVKLKIQRVIWLPQFPNESTGHIDIFLKYMGKNRMVLASSKNSERTKMLGSVETILKKMGYEVHRIPNEGDPGMLGAHTYTNSLIVNDTVFMPSYADGADSPKEAKEANGADAFAEKIYLALGFRVVPVPSRDMINMGGAVHCMTKQYPEGVEFF